MGEYMGTLRSAIIPDFNPDRTLIQDA